MQPQPPEVPIFPWIVECSTFEPRVLAVDGGICLMFKHPRMELIFKLMFDRLNMRLFINEIEKAMAKDESAESVLSQLRDTNGNGMEEVSDVPEMPGETTGDSPERMDAA